MSPDKIYKQFVQAFPEFKDKAEKYMAVRNEPNAARLYFYDGRSMTIIMKPKGHWIIST